MNFILFLFERNVDFFQIETYSAYKKPFAELIQFLPSDIRQYFQDVQSDYRENLQSDLVAEADVTKVSVRRELVLDLTKSVFKVSVDFYQNYSKFIFYI